MKFKSEHTRYQNRVRSWLGSSPGIFWGARVFPSWLVSAEVKIHSNLAAIWNISIFINTGFLFISIESIVYFTCYLWVLTVFGEWTPLVVLAWTVEDISPAPLSIQVVQLGLWDHSPEPRCAPGPNPHPCPKVYYMEAEGRKAKSPEPALENARTPDQGTCTPTTPGTCLYLERFEGSCIWSASILPLPAEWIMGKDMCIRCSWPHLAPCQSCCQFCSGRDPSGRHTKTGTAF